jgi:outer membrane lipase/esterase
MPILKQPRVTTTIKLLIGSLASIGTALAFAAPLYSGMVVFGDSLSDSGNQFAASGSPGAPYFQGQASNGPVWVTLLGQNLGIAPSQNKASVSGGTNYAYSGAATGINQGAVPGTAGYNAANPLFLTQQLALFAASGVPVSATTLYVVAMGGNDVGNAVQNAAVAGGTPAALNQLGLDINKGLAQLTQSITTLTSQGAKNVLLYDVPNLGITPRFAAFGPAVVDLGSKASLAWNAGLAGVVSSFRASGIDVDVVSLMALQTSAIANPGAYGFDPKTINSPCLVAPTATTPGSLCADPSKYFYWDSFHPTAVGHQLLAAAAFNAVVPAPATALLLLMSLALMAGTTARKRSA